ncbi:SDR family oxidoreductase [Nocardioides carbamazepini]|uniref:SDR family NAD(P)-dependent oxidoreductase n=1 Tax=Nocardioides carbamazepini TaxID=2854259 RepID=UPI002149BABE|nr:SDR family oxidoreductase [Nocardioides carbamazepini]MCR1784911.1 SDR family oxidoreductase [Nocardioides carbamazepini]
MGEHGTGPAVLVSGGSRGIGAAIVDELVARGAQVMATSRRMAVEDDREPRAGVAQTSYALGDDASAARAVEVAVDAFGALDHVVANAGVWRGGRLADVDLRDWAAVLEQNVLGTAQLCRAAIPRLRGSRHSPSLTVVSSVVARIGSPGDTAYAAAKAALGGLTRSLACELAVDGIRVNAVLPGLVRTDMTDALPAGTLDKLVARLPMRRTAEAEEIARAVGFLALDATYCTGTELVVDGGWQL